MEEAQNIGAHKGNVVGQGFREHGGQGGECVVGADSEVRDGTISEDENSSDGVDVILDLSRNVPLVELVLLQMVSVS